jgi:predicted dehydrogenase
MNAAGSRQHFVTHWGYEPGPEFVALEGGWVPVAGFGFRMRYRVFFEDAVAEFRHDERHPLRITTAGGTRIVPLARESAYEAEVRHVLRAVRDGTELRVTLADAARAIDVIQQERELLEGRTRCDTRAWSGRCCW